METERLQKEKKIEARDAAAREEAEKRKLTAQGTAEPVQQGHQIKKKPKKHPNEPELYTAAAKREAAKKPAQP